MLMCCGLTTFDVTQVVDRLPAPDEKVTGRASTVMFGGPAANAAATAAALGVATTLVTAIGSGPVGRVVRAQLETAGVRVIDLLEGHDVDPPVSTVLVTEATGERAVVSVNDTASRAIPAAPVEALDGAGVLLLDGWLHAAAVPLARTARARGVRTVLDGGSFKLGTVELLAECDVAIVSADFELPPAAGAGFELPPTTASGAASRTGSASSSERDPTRPAPRGSLEDLVAISALGPGYVARSAGGGPIATLVEGAVVDVPVPSPYRVVDTLGAGDVLHGAFAAAWHEWPGHPFEALELAARVATASVEHAGARGWVAERASGFATEIREAVSAL